MPDYRRYYFPGSLIFITCVTYQRIPYMGREENYRLFWETLYSVQEIHPFQLFAHVLLPDHFHWVMKMPEEDANFSSVIQSVKRNFTFNFKKAHGIETPVHLWQDRFWDHIIRNEVDLERHCDYIHWNPVKHGYTDDPTLWEQSSLQHWISQGYYSASWGRRAEPDNLRGLFIEE